MANIFYGIRKIDDESLRYLIATMETVTMGNIAGEMGQKAKNKSVKVINSISSIFGKKQFNEPQVFSIEERVLKAKEELNSLDSEKLRKRLTVATIKRANSVTNCITSNMSSDEVSAHIIDIAAKNYKDIDENLTPSQKAEAIRNRYNEKLLSQTREKLKNQTSEEMLKTNNAIENSIKSMSSEQQEELKKALGIDELTGSTIRKMLSTTAGTTAILGTINVAGFGAYMALSSIIHAVFTTALGITVPFAAYTTASSFLAFVTGPVGWMALGGVQIFLLNKNKNKLSYELLSQLVWYSVQAYGNGFAPKEEQLPSWLPDNMKAKAMEESNEYKKLIKDNEELKVKYKKANEALNNKEKMINHSISEIQRLTKELEEANNLEAEWKVEESESLRRSIEEKQKKIRELKENVSCNEEKIREYEEYISILKNNLTISSEKLEKQTEGRRKELESRWEKTFKKFVFSKGVVREVVRTFGYTELGDIESILMEIHEANDPIGIYKNRGKMSNGDAHAGFTVANGVCCRVFYRLIKDKPNKKIEITEIVKHSNSRYGKSK